ncbi:MAG TPA: hypothetical protein VJT75_12290 [Thermoleophilaceae bacterium]|nr:hypothetical protein [Thermoleophilaceae bacterium]
MLSKTRLTVLALTGAIAMTGAAEAASTPKLTIKGPNGDFQGTIKASKRKCMNGRTVHVFMKTDEGPQEIGSDTSELNADKTRGRWSIGNSGYKNGEFFAKADPKGNCKPLKSKTITVVTPDAEEPEGGDSESGAAARTVGGSETRVPHVVAGSGILTVDYSDAGSAGIDGYDDAKCQDLLRNVNLAADVIYEEASAGEPESSRATQAGEIGAKAINELTDNCLVVD